MMLVGQSAALAVPSVSLLSAVASDGSYRLVSDHRATQLAQATSTPIPRSVARRLQQDLASRLNVSPESLQVVEATSQTWPDHCFGLARPNERCMGGEIQGWQVHFASAQQMWTYRSDLTGQRFRLEPLTATPDFGTGDFSIETSQRLLQTIAEQTEQPIANLEVLEVQSATWDGCLGIYAPDIACNAIAWAGFRTLISDGQTVWAYHLNETAEQIAQNGTASGASDALTVSFMPIENSLEPTDCQVIFQSQLSGDLAGSIHKTILTADGKLYRELSNYLNGGQTMREDLKTLTAEEVETFRQQLEQHRFFNLNRLRYLTTAAFADYPTTRLQMGLASVEYIDLEVDNLPPDLQAIIAAWEALSQ